MARRPRRNIKSRPVRRRVHSRKSSTRSIVRQMTVPRSVGTSYGSHLYPSRFISKMRWNKSYQIAAGTQDIAQIFHFNLAGMFDPEVTAAPALQPYGFDQLKSYYSHYQVLGAKVTVSFTLASGNNMVVGLGMHRDTTTTTYSNRDTFMNLPSCRYKLVTTQRPTATVTRFYSKKKVYGHTKDEDLTAAPTANPTEGFYANAYLNNLAPGGAQGVVDMVVTITYIGLWTERASIGAS